ncbi:GNAT family N-acetyltransferase [Bordetella hinzii]|uniref:N-acetyltransferase n=1 Tax=Bordetella hinzii TaxID=103855 RepID=A0AAN1VEU6_9BORD|nr:N-acetyltransferase [Bordetella hinzii]QET46470.1 GNAT family N-acetyltransferase [Bordetella hinzii]
MAGRGGHPRQGYRSHAAPPRRVGRAGLSRRAVGLAEAALRRDYVNGCETSPVAFLEGLYVVPDSRRQGVGAALCAEIERWGREQGCREFASDTALDNHASQALHRRLGFAETERVVFFRKPLA